MACMAFLDLSLSYLIHPTPSTKQKGQAFPHLFAFAHIFTLPAMFPPKQTYGDSYPFFGACSNVFSYDKEMDLLVGSPFCSHYAPQAFLCHCT